MNAIDERIFEVSSWPNVHSFNFKLKVGDKVNKITSSLNRYGQFIVTGENRAEVDELVRKYEKKINELITIQN